MAPTTMINERHNLNFELKKGVYLVAGATGMIGSHALRLLANQDGVEVIAVSHKRKEFFFADNIKYIYADLTDEKECLKKMTCRPFPLPKTEKYPKFIDKCFYFLNQAYISTLLTTLRTNYAI